MPDCLLLAQAFWSSRFRRNLVRFGLLCVGLWYCVRFAVPAFDIPHPHAWRRWESFPASPYYSQRRCRLCGEREVKMK
jgi:hypothetical protein